MGRIWIRELTGGLDTRRMPATTPGGVLIKGENGHINSGGEFEKRQAIVPRYNLPATGTVSLAYTTAGLLVFGHGTAPALPPGVSYQRLQHPSNSSIALVSVLSFDLYGGKVYAVGLFADGSIYHYYDGTNVTDWFDGRARAAFRVTGGSVTPATHAAGSFEVTGGTNGAGNEITSVKIDGVDVLTGPIAHTGNNATTASAIASAINSLVSTPDYTATASGQTVNVQAAATGIAANGKAIIVAVGGTATVGNVVNMAGGAAATTSTLSIMVNGVSITSGPVAWGTSHEATAAAIASAINSFTSVPDYDATAVGETVNIIAANAGAGPNGFVVSFTTTNGFLVEPAAGLAMNGGVDSAAFVPGKFVKTIGSKVYSVSDGTLHFSGIRAPTKWTTDATGAGFINMSQETSNAEELVAVANYQGFIAVFAPRVVLIYYVDPDPDLNSKSQILRNTGTNYPGSVTEFGDSDLFYLAESGCRSLKARDSSNAASTTDIGVPVDTLVRAKLRGMTPEERSRIQGLINPTDGRFWLIMGDTVFVFSFFPNSRVSAWTTYQVGTLNGDIATSFAIENAVVFGDTVYMRSGNTIYAFGDDGSGNEVYDDTVAKAHLPFLSADKPTEFKGWNGIDCAVEGGWKLYAAPVLNNASVRELVATATETTYDKQRHPYQGQSTHVSMQFESFGPGPATLSSALLHYVGGEDN